MTTTTTTAGERRRYEGPLCPECQRRGRHMPWCSTATSTALAAPTPEQTAPLRDVDSIARRMKEIQREIQETEQLERDVLQARNDLEVARAKARSAAVPARHPSKRKPDGPAFSRSMLDGTQASRDYAWATEGSDDFRVKVKRRIEREAVSRARYLAAGGPWRSVTPGGKPASPSRFLPGWERRGE